MAIVFQLSSQMESTVPPLPFGTVVWFESLGFMSLGHGLDMILLFGGDVGSSNSGSSTASAPAMTPL